MKYLLFTFSLIFLSFVPIDFTINCINHCDSSYYKVNGDTITIYGKGEYNINLIDTSIIKAYEY